MGSTSIIPDRPDNLLMALVFNLNNKLHVSTVVGHYSEHLPHIDLSDPEQKNRIYLEVDGVLVVILQNCVKKWKDFKQFYEMIAGHGFKVNMKSVFFDLHNICEHYTAINEYGKPYYDVYSHIRRDAIKAKYSLIKREREFDLDRISTRTHHVPIEFGTFLQSVQG